MARLRRDEEASPHMALGPDDLVLCAGTLARVPLRERVEIAAATGFRGISLFLDDLEGARRSGLSDADLRALLEANGLQVAELDPLMHWIPEPGDARATAEGKGFLRWGEEDFYDAAAAVDARSINAVLFASRPVEEGRLVESFAALCDRARECSLLVHLEFMPFSQVSDVSSALSIVEAAGRSNGGVMFDVWHHFRGGGSAEALARAAPRVLGIQLDDAPAQAESNVVDETLHRRLLPGEGDADVAEQIRILDAGGCRAPLGVEVFCDDLATLAPIEVAQRCAEATRRVVAEARAR
jgi:sugar phosphate isomerase/epimerase